MLPHKSQFLIGNKSNQERAKCLAVMTSPLFSHQHASSDVERLLVGNKCDLEKKRAVESERGEELARSHGIPFMETSAKTGHNINEVRGHL